MSTLNFQALKKSYLDVTLTDGTVLHLGTPTKKLNDELVEIKKSLTSLTDDENIDVLYRVCALILSRNKEGREISQDYVEANFDLEDLVILFKGYVDFITEIRNLKN